MTQEEKMLLIKDLSARLPYAVTVEHTSGFRGTLHDITVHHMYDENDNVYDAICYTDFFGDEDSIYIEYFKPYLFPLSSISEEQKSYINGRWGVNENFEFEIDPLWGEYFVDICDAVDFINWCYENHFDINGLIPRGLAEDATDKNIY
jgi:hypothetical protein